MLDVILKPLDCFDLLMARLNPVTCELLQRFHSIDCLGDDDKHPIMRRPDAFLTKKNLQELAR
jgi:hypothetical protein